METVQPRIEQMQEKKLVGMSMRMSLYSNKTGELWQGFMPRRKEIPNAVGPDLVSVQVVGSGYFEKFDPAAEFEKRAAVEVTEYGDVPAGMETFDLPGGLYAVFLHKGGPSTGAATFSHIYGTWLPASGYVRDDRPQFEILGEKYSNTDPDSEEEIWIPIRPKAG